MSTENTVAFNRDLNFFIGNGQWKNSTKFETPLGTSYPTETKVLEVTGRGRIKLARLNLYSATGGYGFSAGDKLKIVIDDDVNNTLEWLMSADYVSTSGTVMGVQTLYDNYSTPGTNAILTPYAKTGRSNHIPYENWNILGAPFYNKNFKVYVVRKQRAEETQNIACTVEYTKDND